MKQVHEACHAKIGLDHRPTKGRLSWKLPLTKTVRDLYWFSKLWFTYQTVVLLPL